MNTYVSPNSAWRSLRRFRICACTDTSSAETGSSQTISSRACSQRAGDPDALPLTARELVREPVVVLRVQPDHLEELLHPALALRLGADVVDDERLGDDEADALARIEGRVRILEDHLSPRAARERSSLPPRGS